ncbi:MAG TPA: polysaccharide deacetylase family protein [Thermoanaerobaculia bacterium]|nr:polysaccharide deacetylase family protein [Thermoanaerobaculia bacterium]
MILGFAAVAPIGLILLWPHSPLAGVGVLALSHALLFYPTFRPNVQWLGPVVTRFATKKPEVWLTIDDGPTEDTRAVLDLFERHGVRATFFVKGVLAAERPELVQEIVARGHSVANHSHTHPSASFWCSLPGRVGMEVDGCNRALADATGAAPRWFRAPVGIKNPAVHPVLKRRGMRLIGWSARGFDSFVSDGDQVLARLLPDLGPGAILMLHQGREHSLRVLERAIVGVKERGYTFVIPDDEQLRTA